MRRNSMLLWPHLFSGHDAKNSSSSFCFCSMLAASLFWLYLIVGAGKYTSAKSASRAMIMLATTKSSSEENAAPRLVNSAVVCSHSRMYRQASPAA